jgi:hypothetical protein
MLDATGAPEEIGFTGFDFPRCERQWRVRL